MFHVNTIYNYTLNKLKSDVESEMITEQKIHKLLYFMYGYELAVTNNSLFTNDIEFWEYGPIIPDLYRTLPKNVNLPNLMPVKGNESFKDFDKFIINTVYEKYKNISGINLSVMANSNNSLFKQLVKDLNIKPPFKITNDLIKQHFFYKIYQKRIDIAKNF